MTLTRFIRSASMCFRPSDQAVLFVGNTKWACIEIASGRPKRMSPTFTHAYTPLDSSINPYDFTVSYAQ